MNIERSAEQHEGESTISIVCVWKHELKTAGRKNPRAFVQCLDWQPAHRQRRPLRLEGVG